jgi:hypothetical protein
MKHHRTLAFGILFLLVASITAFIKRGGGVDAAGLPLLVALDVAAVLCVAAIVVDTVWHAYRGRGQACRHCGHVRPMPSFRMVGPCPHCGH